MGWVLAGRFCNQWPGVSDSVVVDASLAVKWLVEENDSDKAHAVLESWVTQDVTGITPHLMRFEVANALHRRVLRGELSIGDSTGMIARQLESRLELHRPPGLHVGALQLQANSGRAQPTTPTTWRWRRVSVANCGPPTRGSTGAASPNVDNLRWTGEFVTPE